MPKCMPTANSAMAKAINSPCHSGCFTRYAATNISTIKLIEQLKPITYSSVSSSFTCSSCWRFISNRFSSAILL